METNIVAVERIKEYGETPEVSSSYNFCIFNICSIRYRIIKFVFTTTTIFKFSKYSQEAAWEKPDLKPPSDWPSRAHVQFDNYQMRYRDGMDLVLHGISCSITGGEKVNKHGVIMTVIKSIL